MYKYRLLILFIPFNNGITLQFGTSISTEYYNTIVFPVTFKTVAKIFCQRRAFETVVYEQTANIWYNRINGFHYQMRGYNTNTERYPIYWLAIGY